MERGSISRRKIYQQQRDRHRFIMTAMMTLCLIMACAFSYHSIKTRAMSADNSNRDIYFKYYTCITVESGETLWDIADEYIDYDQYKDKNAYIAEVIHINHLDEDASIRSGQRITVPYYSTIFIK